MFEHMTFQLVYREVCKQRNDELSQTVFGKIAAVNHLHAADAQEGLAKKEGHHVLQSSEKYWARVLTYLFIEQVLM